jgi:hypothetical protein
MKRRQILQAGMGIPFCPPLLASTKDGKLNAAVSILDAATASKQVHAFASDSHPEASGPTLELTFGNGEGVSKQ